MTRSNLRKPYPFHVDDVPKYSAEQVATMMRARDKRAARKRRKERAAMLTCGVAVISVLLIFFAYLSR